MDSIVQPGTASPREAVQTLGEFIYRDKSQPRTSEKEWFALVQAIAGGDTSSFATLYLWTHGLVFTSMVRITGNRSIAEDLTVEVFHEVWRGASSYDPASSPVIGWIMNLARARALDRRRAVRAIDPVIMRAAVQTLSTGERQAIEDTYFSELTYVQLAAREGLLATVVLSRIRSGLGRLRAFLMLGFRPR